MSEKDYWERLAEAFEKLPPGLKAEVLINPDADKFREFLERDAQKKQHCAFEIAIPGHFLGISNQRRRVAVKACLSMEHDKSFNQLVAAAKSHLIDWWPQFIERALTAPDASFLRPEKDVYVLTSIGLRVSWQLIRAYREGGDCLSPFARLALKFASEGTTPPWTLSFAIAAMPLAAAELCRRFAERRSRGSPRAAVLPDQQSVAQPIGQQLANKTVRRKRSTQAGEAEAKMIAALLAHHRYEHPDGLFYEAIGCNELARQAGVAESTASEFFKSKFNGHSNYQRKCRDTTELAQSLRVLAGEFAPKDLPRQDR